MDSSSYLYACPNVGSYAHADTFTCAYGHPSPNPAADPYAYPRSHCHRYGNVFPCADPHANTNTNAYSHSI